MSEEIINNQDLDQNNTENVLSFDKTSKNHLVEIAKWAKFLAIVGFVFIGIIVILGFSMGTIFSHISQQAMPFPAFIFGFLYLIIGAIYFYPLYSLLKFANNAKIAVNQTNSESLKESLRHLKGLFTFMGILTIISLGFLVLEIVGLLAFMPFLSNLMN